MFGRVVMVLALLLLAHTVFAESLQGAGQANPERDPLVPWLDNEFYKIHIDLRARIELADQDGFSSAQAYTFRTRAGIESKPYYGFSALAELENVWSLDDGAYFDGASTPNGETQISDPEVTQLNRAWGQFAMKEWWDVSAKGGRQRIILDDARFLGNVGWRQNEQTFDAARGGTSLSVEDLRAEYAYLWYIRRIFGDQGPQAQGGRDWESDSHVAHLSYTGLDWLQMAAFAYLLDFENDSPGNSSNSYGLRLHGMTDVSEKWGIGYAGSYAFQTDAGDNPVDYDAHYAWVSGKAVVHEIGSLELAYELFSSDGGDARFVTPLATAHKFNGYADAFLDNGGPRGLQDLFFTIKPKLPWKLEGHISFHEFWSEQGSDHLGRELDGVVSRKINDYITALTKVAWFDGTSRGPDDRWKLWFELNFHF